MLSRMGPHASCVHLIYHQSHASLNVPTDARCQGYTYSVFNLVYETNVASCRIWDALGFKRIGRVKGAGQLKSYPGQYIDAHIYGRELGPEGEDYLNEERFEKIKFYLKHGKYPNGADRAEKSRLRSAVTHYKLLDDDRLMLKDKEVIPDGQMQYEIARKTHVAQQHAGINKTTGVIAEKYHWVRIKETVGLVIRNCQECREVARPLVGRGDGGLVRVMKQVTGGSTTGHVSAAGRVLSLSRQEMEREERKEQERQQQEPTSQLQVLGQQQEESVVPPPSAMTNRQQPLVERHPLSGYAHQSLDARTMSEARSQWTRDAHEEHHTPPHHGTGYQALLESDDHTTFHRTAHHPYQTISATKAPHGSKLSPHTDPSRRRHQSDLHGLAAAHPSAIMVTEDGDGRRREAARKHGQRLGSNGVGKDAVNSNSITVIDHGHHHSDAHLHPHATAGGGGGGGYMQGNGIVDLNSVENTRVDVGMTIDIGVDDDVDVSGGMDVDDDAWAGVDV